MEKYKKDGVQSPMGKTKETLIKKKPKVEGKAKGLKLDKLKKEKLSPTKKASKPGKENKKIQESPAAAPVKKDGGGEKKKNGKRLTFDNDEGKKFDISEMRPVRKEKVDVKLEEDSKEKVADSGNSKKRRKNKSRAKGNESAPEQKPDKKTSLLENAVSDTKSHETKKSKNFTGDSCVDDAECTVFVGNLPLIYDHKKVMKLFSKYGKVESARIRCVPVATYGIPKRTTAITKNFHPNRKSLSAFVVFTSKESAAKAIADNGTVVDGHHLRIDSTVPHKRDMNKSVFVGGLPFDLEDDELWDAFKDCGEIEDVRIIRDGSVSLGKGFGYVNFKSISSVELALKLNGEEIKNRKINVERCVRAKKRKRDIEDFQKPVTKRKMVKKQGKGKQIGSNSKDIPPLDNFQGKKAELKKKKKKRKLTKDAAWKNKIKSVFQSTGKKLKSGKGA